MAPSRRLSDRLEGKGLAGSTVRSSLNITSGLLKFALKRKLIPHNPARDLDRDDLPSSKRQTEPRYLSLGEIDQVLGALSETFRPVVATCAFCALRKSEALGLRWCDVDFKRETLTVSGQLDRKGQERTGRLETEASKATVLLLPLLRDELLAHRSRQAGRNLAWVRPDALVFVTARGRPQSGRNVNRALSIAAEKVGLLGEGRENVSPQDMRHSFVAPLSGWGCPRLRLRGWPGTRTPASPSRCTRGSAMRGGSGRRRSCRKGSAAERRARYARFQRSLGSARVRRRLNESAAYQG